MTRECERLHHQQYFQRLHVQTLERTNTTCKLAEQQIHSETVAKIRVERRVLSLQDQVNTLQEQITVLQNTINQNNEESEQTNKPRTSKSTQQPHDNNPEFAQQPPGNNSQSDEEEDVDRDPCPQCPLCWSFAPTYLSAEEKQAEPPELQQYLC